MSAVTPLDPHIAYCGLDCSGCDVYRATKLDSNDLRQEYANKVFSQFRIKVEPATINCHGCRDERPKTNAPSSGASKTVRTARTTAATS